MQDCSILRFHPSGYFMQRFNLQPWANGYGCLTSGLAVDSNNHLWVTSRTDPGFVFRIDANQDSSPVIGVVRSRGMYAPEGLCSCSCEEPVRAQTLMVAE